MEPNLGANYQLLDKLGSGGMGEVYRARDTRLNRTVAVKVLRSDFRDPERQRRFLQEAQAASGLNHPNIITIHDIIHEDGNDLMVMEYVSGKTLIDLIPPGGLRVPQVINYGMQIADALAAAHAAGIIHRDLKPGNIMVSDKGLVKLLDFGLAKLALAGMGDDDPDATMLRPMTIEGSIIGTLCYMSPEQAQGKKVDARSDIFSFGSVLYEMATGTRAFSGDNSATMLSAVLRDEPTPIATTSPDVPPELASVIQRCLRKNPDDRYQTMQEVHVALRDLKRVSDSGILYRSHLGVEPETAITARSSSAGPTSTPSAPRKSSAGIIAIVAILVIAVGGGGWWWFANRRPSVPEQTAAPAQTAPVEAMKRDEALDNDAILNMVKARVSASLIKAQIRSATKRDFDLRPNEIIRLVQGGVSEDVIEVMRDPDKAPSSSKAGQQPAAGPADTVAAPPKPAPDQTPSTSGGLVTPPPAPPTNPNPPPAAGQAVASGKNVRTVDGTPFMLVLTDDVPRDAAEGTPIHFVVLTDVKVGDTVIIPKGARAVGEVYSPSRKKMFGRESKVTYRLIEVAGVNGAMLKIRATPSARDAESSGRPLDPTGNKAKDIAAPKGTQVPAYLVGSQAVNL